MGDRYRIDMSRLSFAEAWRWGGIRHVLVIAFFRLTRRRFLTSVPLEADREIVVLDTEGISADRRARVGPFVNQLHTLGFRDVFWYDVSGTPQGEGLAVALLHASGETVGVVSWAAAGGRARAGVTLVSPVPGGYVVTGNDRGRFDPPPEVDAARHPANSAGELVEVHMNRISGRDVRSLTEAEVKPLLGELQRVIQANLLRRGLYVPV